VVFRHLTEVGPVAYVYSGPGARKLVMIVDVIDQNRALVDGPCTQVRRQAMPFKCTQLPDFIIKFPHSADINTKRAATRRTKKIEARESKAKMTDFDRYEVMKGLLGILFLSLCPPPLAISLFQNKQTFKKYIYLFVSFAYFPTGLFGS
uniref:Large ribosomal subunit protein eL14 n=1 Tax=Panthera leo TaxID=9689 RepID=A0A8C8X829_PANLE